MKRSEQVRASKFLSLVLRHRPETIGLRLDGAGWASVEGLLEKLAAAGRPLTRGDLDAIVIHNDKQRFELDAAGERIRARQGHSIDVALGYPPTAPPPVLYHGTAERNVESIRREGLRRGQRHHVHLSETPETAEAVGRRYGKPVVLRVEAGRMHDDGFTFYRTPNGVWLCEQVPAAYVG